MATKARIYWGISGFFAVKFFSLGIFIPYFPVVLSERGLDSREVALVLAIAPIVRIVTSPLLGTLADRFRNRRTAALLYALLGAVTIAPILWAESFIAFLVIVTLSSVFWLAVLPVADALAVVAARTEGLRYGRMRLWGSLSFIVANFAAGWALDLSGPEFLALVIVATYFAAGFAALGLPRNSRHTVKEPEPERTPLWSMPALTELRIRPGAALLLTGAAIGQGSHAMVYAFGTIHWQSLGLKGV